MDCRRHRLKETDCGKHRWKGMVGEDTDSKEWIIGEDISTEGTAETTWAAEE